MTGYGIVLPVLPFFAEELGLSSFQMSSLITGWAFTQFLVLPFWGKIIDQWGRKPVLVFGLVGFGIAFMLMALAQNYWQLLLIRIVGAILSSGTQPAVLAIVADTSGAQERGNAMAKIAAANGLGFLFGPTIGSLFASFGITIPFIIAGLLSLITVPLVALYIKEPNHRTEQQRPIPLSQSIGHSFKSDYFMLFMITFGIAIATSSILGILGYFMMEKFDSTASEAGMAFTIQAAAAVICQLFVIKQLYKRWSDEKIEKYGMFITACGFAFMMTAQHVSFVFIGVFLVGAGQALIKPILLTLLSKKNGIRNGMVMSLQGAYDSLGRSIGPLLAGSMLMFDEVAPFILSFSICLLLFVVMIVEQMKVHKVLNRGEDV